MIRNMIYITTIVNIIFQAVYMTFGTYTTLALGLTAQIIKTADLNIHNAVFPSEEHA